MRRARIEGRAYRATFEHDRTRVQYLIPGRAVTAKTGDTTAALEGDAVIINMPSAGSHKSRVIEFSTSITGRRRCDLRK